MSLVITVSKAEVKDLEFLATNRRGLFEKVTESTEQYFFVPMPGKLADILKNFTENNVAYHVSNSAHVAGKGNT